MILGAMPFIAMAAEPEANAEASKGKFAWGAEAGVGIDMGGDDMTTLNLHASFGYKNSWLRFAGIGAGIDVMLSNSSRSFPIYAMARTSFSNKPKLLFGDMRVGIAYNQTDGVPDRANFFIQPGLGIELAKGKSFTSYLLLAYTYDAITFYGDKANTLVHGLNRATVSLGISF